MAISSAASLNKTIAQRTHFKVHNVVACPSFPRCKVGNAAYEKDKSTSGEVLEIEEN